MKQDETCARLARDRCVAERENYRPALSDYIPVVAGRAAAGDLRLVPLKGGSAQP